MDNSMSIFEAKRKRIEIISFWECTRVWTLAAQNQQLLWEWCKRVKRKENVESEKMQRKIERNKENKREGKKKWKREKWCKVKSEVWADRKIQKDEKNAEMDGWKMWSDFLWLPIAHYFSRPLCVRLFLCLFSFLISSAISVSLSFRLSVSNTLSAPLMPHLTLILYFFFFSITLSDVINVSRMCVTVAPPTCSQISKPSQIHLIFPLLNLFVTN